MTEAEKERAAVVAWLRELNKGDTSHNHWLYVALRIERLDHLKEQENGR